MDADSRGVGYPAVMHRFLILALVVILAGCSVEPVPEVPQDIPAAEEAESTNEPDAVFGFSVDDEGFSAVLFDHINRETIQEAHIESDLSVSMALSSLLNYPVQCMDRVQTALSGTLRQTYGPTTTHRRQYDIATEQFEVTNKDLKGLIEGDFQQLVDELEKAGAPWTSGRRLPQVK